MTIDTALELVIDFISYELNAGLITELSDEEIVDLETAVEILTKKKSGLR